MELDPQNLKQMAELGKNVYNALPDDAKKNLFIPTSESIGKTGKSFADILGFPFNVLALKANAHLSLLEHRTNEKLEFLKKQGKYTEEKVGVAVKAIENSKYSLNSELLREYFSQLISNSLNKDYVDNISPNFATILSNLTEEDALFLKRVKELPDNDSVLLTSINGLDNDNNSYSILTDICIWDVGVFTFSDQSTLATLQSFGIIEIIRDRWWTTGPFPAMYKSFENSDHFKTLTHRLESQNHNHPYDRLECRKGYASITKIGSLFLDIVVI